MRKVEIIEEPRAQRCFLAVDVKSGEPILRLHDRELLQRICRSLEWKIVRRQVERPGQLDKRFHSGTELTFRN
jgi:hypothetical protein